ncbi:MAG: thiamine pyrophosphate-binding protein [Christensenellaceae bacterium]|nr:thiamine pyrophosphate-binding protein [Christensenellaceae bacterium]MEA5066052.1 thiamine pyrophosphate-binding protein [Eubacteriales bacterium]MEA5067614.1 thiamine pyrophosphate-binding protein [Christensenellaceae bacterium]
MKLTGGQIVVKYLEKEGVPYALGIPGHGVLGFFDALRESGRSGGIKYLQVKHEQTALHIADGYFRIKQEPLCVFTSIGPGAMNTAIGLATAYVDSSAIFQVSGDTHVQMKGVGVLQEIERYQDSNFLRALEPLCKRAWRAESVGQLPRIMQRAFNQMLGGRRGPVVLALPMNVQADALETQLPEPAKHRALRAGAGDEGLIRRAAELMRGAKRPVILAGGALFGAEDRLVELAERWGAAVITTMASKSVFPEDHPLNGFHTGSKGTPVGLRLTQTADVVLALGTRFADETTCSYRYGAGFKFPDTRLIHVDIEPGELGKNYPCDVGVLGDVQAVMGQLLTAYGDAATGREAYHAEMAELKAQWRRSLEDKRAAHHEQITISQLIGELNECLPEGAILATSSGNTQAQAFQEFAFKKGQRHLTSGGFSTMGWAMPAAIGAKLAAPDAPVIALMGDGDFMMTMQELTFLKQYDVPVVVIVADNSGWMAIKDLQSDVLGVEHTFGNDFEADGVPYSPDFAEIARSFGIASERLSQPGELKGALKRALEGGKPTLLHVRVCREYPHSGGEAFGWWDVPVPAYMEQRRAAYLEGLGQETV